MENNKRIRYVEIARDIYAAITPVESLDITDAGLMNNFSNSAYINRGEGLICDTFFDLPHARELNEFCIKKSGHTPKYVINTHGHWDHFWGNQIFEKSEIIGHKDMLKDCKDDKKKVRIFKLLYGSVFVQNLISGIMTASFKKNLSDGKKAKFIVRVGDNDFNLSGLVPKNPDTLIEDNMQFNLGGTDVHLIHLGSIHSGSDMIVWIPSEKILFAGDIFADCSLPMSIENGKKWIQAMDYILEELKPEIIVPGHGEIYDFKRAENQREYFKSLIGQVEHYYTPTIKNEELIKKIDVEKYIDCRPGLLWILAVNNMANQLRKDKI